MKLIENITLTDMDDTLIISVEDCSAPDSIKVIKVGNTGKDIIHYIQSGLTEAEIIQCLVDQYSVSACEIEEDVKSFLEGLNHLGLIEP